MSENSTVISSDFQTADEALQKFNEFLEKLHLKQRWTSLEEIKVEKKTNWFKIISSEEFLKIIEWILIVNLRIQLINFLNNIETYFFILAYHLILTAYFSYKNYQEKQPEFPQFAISMIKQAGLFAVILLAFEGRFLNLPIPETIKSVSFFFFPVIVFSQYSILTDVSLTFKLNNSIVIQGQNWKIQRLAMIWIKAVELHQFYTNNYQKSLALKKLK
ncbi:transmembrane protein, putative (macronuclear) [Tetrahymena thermophila SB210]|uniref:Transmembrane protein, putative n=1 Tax=Tetrahymena thermophila (strain SB210) TaxID=312017 RepID=Q236U8_TETTS|nr:transmembrane protein, putative [Tetrahymena thermophila SB210]EAR92402.1 transmembrane protein, putative [Tetrahymena thermophila SB210]|eukprot:XP_001012647.1 transmembrane protein, putative [Tetrahymena thermophila SB210]